MGRAKVGETRITLTLSDDLVNAIDEDRGKTPRATFLRKWLERSWHQGPRPSGRPDVSGVVRAFPGGGNSGRITASAGIAAPLDPKEEAKRFQELCPHPKKDLKKFPYGNQCGRCEKWLG